MGFYNVYMEGQQAEEYKTRKAKETEEKEKAERERRSRRYEDNREDDKSFGLYKPSGNRAPHYSIAGVLKNRYTGKGDYEGLGIDKTSILTQTPNPEEASRDKERNDATTSVRKRIQEKDKTRYYTARDQYWDADSEARHARNRAEEAERRYNSYGLFKNIAKGAKEAKTTAEDAREMQKAAEDKKNKAAADSDQAMRNHNYYQPDMDDAINRHMRRHPDQWDGDKRIKTRSESCGIFESVVFIND